MFGDEFVQVLDAELEKAYEKLVTVKENEIEEEQKDPMEQIKSVIIFSRQGEIENINSLEQLEVKNIQESKGERNE